MNSFGESAARVATDRTIVGLEETRSRKVAAFDSFEMLDSLDRLMTVLIHEINNPLGTALSATQIASRLNKGVVMEQWLGHAVTSIRSAATATKHMQILCEPCQELKGYAVVDAINAAIVLSGIPSSVVDFQPGEFQRQAVGQARVLTLALIKLFDYALRTHAQRVSVAVQEEHEAICELILRIEWQHTSKTVLPQSLRWMLRNLMIHEGGRCRFGRADKRAKVLLQLQILETEGMK